MPPRNWQFRIRDIRHAAEKIVSHTKDLSFETFKVDEWTQDAVIRNIAVLGEAAREVPDEVTRKYPEIPWAEMRDMRNIVVHEYFGVDLSIVWQTAGHDLPVLIRRLDEMMKAEELA